MLLSFYSYLCRRSVIGSHLRIYSRFFCTQSALSAWNTYSNTNMENIKPKQRCNDILKSDVDKRNYRGLVLSNDLKVLLISDESTDKSAVSLDVHIGYMSDPKNIPGLAHFCEHMLFLGTKKYECENEYSRYLNEHGGSYNAHTLSDHTNYYFDVSPDALPGALDRFAQFFLEPLFTESCVDREVNAVDSEHSKNLQSDLWRISQLNKSAADPEHDFCKFGTGNKKTLDVIPRENGINVRDELLKFHRKWYSSNIMGLAVLGKETLQELEDMVLELFDKVSNKNIVVPEWTKHPFGPSQCCKIQYVLPVKDIRELGIGFPIPDLHCFYKTDPGNYVSHLVGHEGPGSLLSYLKMKNWAISLTDGTLYGAKGFSFFIIDIELTEEGLDNVYKIVAAVFQYLNLLNSAGPQEWIFEECRDLKKMTFTFKDKEQPVYYARHVSQNLHYYPLKEVLCGDFLLSEYKPELISSLMKHLIPDNIRLTLTSRSVADRVTETEFWYGTKYHHACIEDDIINQWKFVEPNEHLALPKWNEFVPTNFTLSSSPQVSPLPELIEDSVFHRLWYKLDDEYCLPKGVVHIEFFSPLSHCSPKNACKIYLLEALFQDALSEYSYAAELAGLYYSLAATHYGLVLKIHGYSDKQYILLSKIMDKLTTFKVDAERFDVFKEKHIRWLSNFGAEQPHHHVIYYMNLLLSDRSWSKEELLQAAKNIYVEDMKVFIPEFLSELHVEFLIHGNISRDEAAKYADTVLNTLQKESSTRPLCPQQMFRKREIKLKKGSSWVFQAENKVHSSSAVQNYYQCGVQSTLANVYTELISQIFCEAAMDILRTKEQLGYIVWCTVQRSNRTQGLTVIIQGDRSPSYLDSRIENFLTKMGESLTEMSEEEFLLHKEALIQRKLEKPKQMSTLSKIWWGEIISNQYLFNRQTVEVDCLKSLQRENIIEFYNDFLSVDAPNRRKLSLQVLSAAPDCAWKKFIEADTEENILMENNLMPNVKLIQNIPDFKMSHSLYPLMKPYISISKEVKKSKM